ncbi:putative bifunctional diguanylate cyclase/phosphodiesterase [Oceanisphaera pacifica]|uniref:EAL domain-containing protein n=1 Tax=Oceanisphaera pacifica TaxID=2818389 RepID=A0ABS3NJ56_9GAMM|nr:bifunctional diguanylate cyclase/phosphodiesterase [Oceanisphaera pacifica]MBO1520629.1 EAL domain-containing protein [Oceanisphaera pacifica]
MLISIIEQAILILASGWLLAMNIRLVQPYPRLLPLTSGFWLGMIAIACITMPFTIGPGVLLDVADAVIFVAGLLSGLLTGGLAFILAASVYIWINDASALVSIVSMALALSLGLICRYALLQGRLSLNIKYLLPLSILLHCMSMSLLYLTVEPQLQAHLLSMMLPFMVVAVPLTLMLIFILKDAHDRQQEQQTLASSQARLLAITSALPDMMSVIDEQGEYIEVTAGNIIFEQEDHRAVGKNVQDVYPAEHAQRLQAFIKDTIAQQAVNHMVFELEVDNELRTFESVAQVVKADIDERDAVVILSRDISERIKDETDLRIAAVAFESFQSLLVTDKNNRILRVNRAFTAITGYQQQDVLGKTPTIFSSGKHDKAFYREMWQDITSQGHWQGEIYDKRKSGQVYPQLLSISAVKDSQGEVSHYVAGMTDLSAQKEDAKKIHHLAFYDALTGLPNRRLLINRIKQIQRDSAKQKRLGAVIFIDLDHFKKINDLWGFSVGDKLLKHIADHLYRLLTEEDCLARLGSDQFVLVLEPQADNKAELVEYLTQYSQRLFTALEQPYHHAEQGLRSSACLGIAELAGSRHSAEELLHQAEMAMYAAKAVGKGEWRLFEPKMQDALSARLLLEEDIKRGLAAKEFCVFFQAQFNSDKKLVGAEALVRWHHPTRGLLAPGAFIEVAEASSIMSSIDQVVLLRACEQMARWADMPIFRDITVSVNISPAQLYQHHFVEDVLAVIEKTGADPQRLKLELTESMLVTDMSQAIERMRQFKQAGIRFAIDDFGTGYSSLQYLQQLPLDQLKIDQSFVRGLPEDSSSLAIIRAVMAMANSLGLEVIAEGVETEVQRDILFANHCYLYQGYLYAKPQAAEQLEAMMQAEQINV